MAELTVYGAPWCPDCKRAKKFLGEHRIPYEWVDVDSDPAGLRHVEEVQQGGRTIPTIRFADGSHLIEPSDEELARKLGLTLEAKRRSYDLVIAGGGPAGLAAAIYAAREGIDSLVVDRGGLGGQAGVTERIDNYPGFPDGVTGAELSDRIVAQAQRYGVELLGAVGVEGIRADDVESGDLCASLAGGQEVEAHAVLVATGASYRRLGVPGEEDLIGAGVHYCATCDGPFYRGAEELMVVGGGNSALEEGMFLTRFADRIRVVQRGRELTASKLLQEKVAGDPRFVVDLDTDVLEFAGRHRLEGVALRHRRTGEVETVTPRAAFVFIGQDPNTAFLRGTVALDERGFVVDRGGFRTSLEGVFVAGDARSGSTKQLGAAIGDGIAALLAIREHLQRHHHIAPHLED